MSSRLTPPSNRETGAASRSSVDTGRPEAKLVGYPVWRTGWQNTDINAKAEAARLEQNPERRAEIYRDIQTYMMHNGPMAYIYQNIRPIAYRTSVKGFEIGPFFVNYGSASK